MKNDYLRDADYEYGRDNREAFASKEIEFFEGYKKVYQTTEMGCKVEVDLDFIDELELDML